MHEMCIAVDEGELNWFILIPRSESTLNEIKGRIVEQKEGKIFVEMFRETIKLVKEDEIYSMKFLANRKNFDLQNTALEYVQKHQLFDCLINSAIYQRVYENNTNARASESIFLKNPAQIPNKITFDGSLNTEQKKAVQNIVRSQSYPLPYLLYGPPGKCYFQLLYEL